MGNEEKTAVPETMTIQSMPSHFESAKGQRIELRAGMGLAGGNPFGGFPQGGSVVFSLPDGTEYFRLDCDGSVHVRGDRVASDLAMYSAMYEWLHHSVVDQTEPDHMLLRQSSGFSPRWIKWSIDDSGELTMWDVFNGVGIKTDQGTISVAQRDSGVEVSLQTPRGRLEWSSTVAWGNDPQESPALPTDVQNLGADGPWPLRSVLTKLADAADHLLTDHDCDEDGYETVRFAAQAARQFVSQLDGRTTEEPWYVTDWRSICEEKPDFKMEDLHGNSNAADAARRCLVSLASSTSSICHRADRSRS